EAGRSEHNPSPEERMQWLSHYGSAAIQAYSAIVLTQVLAVVAAMVGTAGFVLGILNYMRDAPRVRVTLIWDMVDGRTNERFDFIRVANVGRRPIYISHAALKLPRGYQHTHLVLHEGLQGDRLVEGN